ncbi:hypothetical protein SDC9_111454 [bioreactor metagenome]|uniref:Uncharacterized protein n=1 Tax=bioreactor metagenome TaxID=1076179 RepID=A0A645BGS6_9ZZZZ
MFEYRLDLCSILHVAASWIEHGGEHAGGGGGVVEGGGGDVDNVHLPVQQLGKLHRLLDGDAAGNFLLAAQAEFHDQPFAAPGADMVHDHQREAGLVLDSAAILVGAVVVQVGEELADQPAVAAVDIHDVHARELREIRGLGIGVGDGVHHGLVHLDDGVAVEIRLHGAGADNIAVGGEIGAAGPAAGVGQLDGGQRTPLMNGIDGLNQAGQYRGVVQMGHGGVGVIRGGVNPRLTNGYDARSALGHRVVHLKGLPGVERSIPAG